MKRFAVCLFAIVCISVGWLATDCAYAITPPPPVAPTLASVILTITPATTRADKVTPFAASEMKENRLYFTQLSAYIVVPAPTLTYTWIVPSGQCFKTTDAVAATTVDTGGLESAASTDVTVTADRCSGKSLPGAPGVRISVGS
jgi:hypothetical protein